MGGAARFLGLAAGVALIDGGAWFGGRLAIESVVHDYILDHPEILPQAMDNLQRRQTSQTLSSVKQSVETPFPGAVLGNPQGRVTMVEFSDYACGFCRQSLPDVAALIARNPQLRIVVRELPIISPHSPEAAKMALAAAEQGKYGAFHKAMFEIGRPGAETIAQAARTAGLDIARAQGVIALPATEAELVRNLELAKALGFSGTPSWVVGDAMLTGAVGQEQLAKAIHDARS